MGEPSHLIEPFEKVVCPCNFASVPELGYEHFGFTWPLDLTSERSLFLFQRRGERAEEARQKRAKWINKTGCANKCTNSLSHN